LLGDMKKDHPEFFIPELVIYEFGGYGIKSESIIKNKVVREGSYYKFGLSYPENASLFFSIEETGSLFDEFIEEIDSNGETQYECLVNSSMIYYYMQKDDYEKMDVLMKRLISDINNVYEKYGLPIIEMK
jgi:hypothetical protein